MSMFPPPIQHCPHCGTANRAGSNFCNGCGTDLRESLTLEEIAAAQKQPPPETPDDSPTPPPEATSPPSAPPTSDDLADQPWLQLEFAGEDEMSHDADLESEADYQAGSGRLITGIQGLLTPIRITTNITEDTPILPRPTVPTAAQLSNDELRLIRGLMSEPPPLVNYQVRPALRPPRPLRISWIFALLGLAVALPA